MGIKMYKNGKIMPTKIKIDSRRLNLMRRRNIMLKLTDILMQEQLITPNEKIRLITLIEQEDET